MNDLERKFTRKELTIGLQLASKIQKLAESKFHAEPSRHERHVKGIDFEENGLTINFERYAGCGDWETDSQFYSLEDLINQAEQQR